MSDHWANTQAGHQFKRNLNVDPNVHLDVELVDANGAKLTGRRFAEEVRYTGDANETTVVTMRYEPDLDGHATRIYSASGNPGNTWTRKDITSRIEVDARRHDELIEKHRTLGNTAINGETVVQSAA